MQIKSIRVGHLQTNCYIIEDTCSNDGIKSRFCAVIDPGFSPKRIMQEINGDVTHIILTHAHFDHVGAVQELCMAYPNAIFAVGEHEPLNGRFSHLGRNDGPLPTPNLLLKDNSTIGPFTVLHTPGHTKGSICLLDEKDNILISGDTLFKGCYGRTDIEGSNIDMRNSLDKLYKLNPNINVLPGHGDPTTIRDFKNFYPYLVATLDKDNTQENSN